MKTNNTQSNAELILNHLSENFTVSGKKLILISHWNFIGRLIKFVKNLDGSVDRAVEARILVTFEKLHKKTDRLIKKSGDEIDLDNIQWIAKKSSFIQSCLNYLRGIPVVKVTPYALALRILELTNKTDRTPLENKIRWNMQIQLVAKFLINQAQSHLELQHVSY
jgi:hypothetical protein